MANQKISAMTAGTTPPGGTEQFPAVQGGANVQFELFTTQTAGDASLNLATDAFVANAIATVNPASAVDLATAAVLPNSPTYSNGTAGVGATLTAGSNTTLTVDGTAVTINQRVLVKNQVSTFQNGIYSLTQLGSGSVPWILTRATDYNTPANINYTGIVPVIGGSTNANTQWLLTSLITAIGTPNAITYTQQTSGPGSTTPGNVKATPPLTKNELIIGTGGQGIASLASSGTSGQVLTSNGTSSAPSFQAPAQLSQNIQTSSYQLVLADANNVVTMNVTGAGTLTIPANASVAFPVGTIIGVNNIGTGALTVAITSDTLEMGVGGALVTGSITLPVGGTMSLFKTALTTWLGQVGNPGPVKFGTVVTSGAATSVTFSSIPQGYSTIKIIYTAKTSDTGTFANLTAQFNGDATSGHYPSSQQVQGNGGTAGAGTIGPISSFGIGVGQVETTVSGAQFAQGEIVIPNYSQSNTTIGTFGTSIRLASGGTSVIQVTGGAWVPSSLAAVTSITLQCTNSSNSGVAFTNNSIFTLYLFP